MSPKMNSLVREFPWEGERVLLGYTMGCWLGTRVVFIYALNSVIKLRIIICRISHHYIMPLLICVRVLAWSRWLTAICSMFLGMYWLCALYGAGLDCKARIGVRTNLTRIHDLILFSRTFILMYSVFPFPHFCFDLFGDLYFMLMISKVESDR